MKASLIVYLISNKIAYLNSVVLFISFLLMKIITKERVGPHIESTLTSVCLSMKSLAADISFHDSHDSPNLKEIELFFGTKISHNNFDSPDYKQDLMQRTWCFHLKKLTQFKFLTQICHQTGKQQSHL